MSIIMLDTFNYAMDTITGQFAEVRGHALNRLGDINAPGQSILW